MWKNLPTLNEGDTVQLKKDNRIGIILKNDFLEAPPDAYKVDFGIGLYEWHPRSDLRILNRAKKAR